jgi:hypothetical protein
VFGWPADALAPAAPAALGELGAPDPEAAMNQATTAKTSVARARTKATFLVRVERTPAE